MTTPFATPSDRVPSIPDHAEAFASVLRRYAKLISEGRSVEDAARELLPIIRIAARLV